jgi:hypothetical protein
MHNPSPDTKAKLATARKHASSEGSADRWVQTKLEEIENCGDQPRNHWRAARELVGTAERSPQENEDNQDDES